LFNSRDLRASGKGIIVISNFFVLKVNSKPQVVDHSWRLLGYYSINP